MGMKSRRAAIAKDDKDVLIRDSCDGEWVA